MSSSGSQNSHLRPFFNSNSTVSETAEVQAVMEKLGFHVHPEGGYYAETDRDPLRVPNPLPDSTGLTRNASTTIYYLITPKRPLGVFHRNKARTVHTLHRGRGRYVIIHADDVASPECPQGYGGSDDDPESKRWTGRARVEVFTVGQDVLKGERLQWIVEGGKYKSSFLLPDHEGGRTSEGGLLISETVVPGFEFQDHDFMRYERFEALVPEELKDTMRWMVRKP